MMMLSRNEASHDVVKQALDACSCMEHRGASSADNISGDGAGVMTAIPWELFSSSAVNHQAVKNLDGSIATAVGMMFFSRLAFRLFAILSATSLTTQLS
jgi:glutamate synthase (ferredoxin)